VTGTDAGGALISTTIPVDNTTTLGDLVTGINSAFGGAFVSIDASGNLSLTGNSSGQGDLALSLADSAGNTGGPTTFSSFEQTAQGAIGDNNITFQINGLNNPQTVNLNFGTANSFGGLSQFGAPNSATASKQDGFGPGSLVSTTINQDGTITGNFSNGRTMSIAQLAVASFANPAGLLLAGNNFLTATANSGLPLITSPGGGGTGTVKSGSLESSNVDIGTEFTNLISAQRGYEVNAKAFSAANQMMQDTIDLLR
jgi:flagellar hook protein FlgE